MKKAEKALQDIVTEILWRCGDCGNFYTIDVQACPNRILDKLAVEGLIPDEPGELYDN